LLGVSLRRAGIALLAAGAAACAPEDATLAGARRFAEIEARDALGLHVAGDALLVQLRVPGSADSRIGVAFWLESAADVPDAWLDEQRAILLAAHDDANARRLAAQLVRQGVRRVAVVRGGTEAWLDASNRESSR
jgi:hypothetical protein